MKIIFYPNVTTDAYLKINLNRYKLNKMSVMVISLFVLFKLQ